MAKNKRKKLFIDPKVQGALIRRMILHYMIFFVSTCVLAFFMQFLANPMESLNSHFGKLWLTQGPFILVAICLCPIFIRDTVKLSHRFVGPILRIRGSLQSAAKGEQTSLVKLRPGDFWMDLADDLNGLLARIKSGQPTTDQPENEQPEEAVS